MLKMLAFPLVVVLASSAVPKENTEKGEPPSSKSAEAGAAKLLDALSKGEPAIAADFFFPKEAFDLVKDLPVPGRYHKRLVRWYEADIMKEHPRFKRGAWTFEKLEMGRCRWKAVGSEGNKLPYWSCTNNFVTATDGTRKRRYKIQVLINWGRKWYVTHLGPIRK